MKRTWMVILSLVVLVVMLLGALAAPEIIQRRETLGLTVTVKNATSTSATMQCVRQVGFLGGSVEFGSSYYLERLTADGWKELPDLHPDAAWTMEAYPVPLGISQWTVHYSNSYGELSPGTYRLSRRFYSNQAFGGERSVLMYAEFEIK